MPNPKILRKIVHNKENAEVQRKADLVVYPCEEVLGSMKTLQDFSAFYITHKEDLEIIKTHYLMQYCEGAAFTPEQFSAYRLGLEAIISFFKNSESDVDSYLLQAKAKNQRRSVG